MLWGAFNNASTAMMAFSWGMESISQNIANVNTAGYKAKDTEFKTMLSETHASPQAGATGLSIFGVNPADRTLITKQGTISNTDNWTDMAINGRGFFVVANPASTNTPPSSVSMADDSQVMYTRAGSFSQRAFHVAPTSATQSPGANDITYFTTSSGQYLMGWQADPTGRIPGVATTATARPLPGTTGSSVTGSPPALTPVHIQPGTILDGVATTAMYPVISIPANLPQTQSVQVSDGTVVDNNGANQVLRQTWTRTGADSWNVDFTLPNGTGTMLTSTVAVTMDSQGNIATPAGGLQQVNIDWDGDGLSTSPSEQVSLNLGATKPTLSTKPLTLTVYDQNYDPHTVTAQFEHAGNNQWNMRYIVPPTDGTIASITTGASVPLQFDGSGKLVGPTPPAASFTVNWTAATGGSNTVAVDLSQIQQFDTGGANDISIKSLEQNGYESGSLSQTAFNENGELIGHFNNGHTRTLFKVAVASFAAADQLAPISGTLFKATEAAGAVSIGSIEDQGSGAAIVGSAVETSNVDIGDQFSKMIVTQKAYSTNATVFKTADEMTTAVRDLIA